jgi:hypothetical protein
MKMNKGKTFVLGVDLPGMLLVDPGEGLAWKSPKRAQASCQFFSYKICFFHQLLYRNDFILFGTDGLACKDKFASLTYPNRTRKMIGDDKCQ